MMTSSKPYLIRALYEWIIDNNLTPYVVVNAEAPGVQVPKQYIERGRVILNVSPQAAHDLLLTNEWIEFGARFNGVATQVMAPVAAVVAIYARENNRGMVFNDEDDQEGTTGDGDKTPPTPPRPGKPKLSVVK